LCQRGEEFWVAGGKTDARFGAIEVSCFTSAPRRTEAFVAITAQRNQNPSFVAIVDDDDLMRDALRGLLKEGGFMARTFTSAEEFLNAADRAQTACLIADVRMPGISGLDLQARLTAERIRIPIIFITAHGNPGMRMQALRAGAVEFLAKPFDEEMLLESVRAALER